MRYGIRYLCLIAASALLFAGPAIAPLTVLGTSESLAQGKSEGKGGDRGKSSASRGKSQGRGGDRGNSGDSSTSYASRGANSTTGAHQLARDLGMSMGEFSSWVKSWRSAYRAPRAYEATMDNLNSLPGRQYAYADAFVARQTALQAFTDLGGDTNSPPSLTDYNDALAALGGLGAQDVLGDPNSTQAQIDAATTVLQYEAWERYQRAVATADGAFLATLPGNPTTYDPALREAIDDIVVQIGLAGADAGLF